MAEREDKLFEQELAEIFAKMDSEIEIPEIPDVQTIFDKAEQKKANIIPFKKYSKYIAAAAAVVLICVSIPVLVDIGSAEMAMDNANAEADYEPQEAPEIETEAETAEDIEFFLTDSSVTATQRSDDSDSIPVAEEKNQYYPSDAEMKDAVPDGNINAPQSSVASSSEAVENKGHVRSALYHYFASIKNENPSTGGGGFDDVQHIEEYINKVRTIKLTIDKGAVFVLLHENSVNEETINSFWVEGNYLSSYIDGEYYIISLSKKVTEEELEAGDYLPMFGDSNGTYIIPENKIFIPGMVTEGVISMTVSVHVGTGEYEILASLV